MRMKEVNILLNHPLLPSAVLLSATLLMYTMTGP
jgi:hypothetical protein